MGPLRRRAIQLGLRGDALAEYSRDAILEMEDVSAFVAEQRTNATLERVYNPAKPEVAERLSCHPW